MIGATTIVRLLVVCATILVVAATFVPVNGGGSGGYPYAIFDTSVQREFQLFAAEPLLVAVVSLAVAMLLPGRLPSLAGGALLAFGLQTLMLFSAHVGAAAFGNPQYNSFRFGGVLGALGALLLGAAGAVCLVSAWRTGVSRSEPSVRNEAAAAGPRADSRGTASADQS